MTDKLQITDRLGEIIRHQETQAQKDWIVAGVRHYIKELDGWLQKGVSKREIAAFAMEMLDKMTKEHTDWSLITCKKGCAACCHIPVDITEAEGENIVDWCERNGVTVPRKYLKQQMRDKSGEFRKCAFLSDENTCKIYEARPARCRMYLVKTPAIFCDITKFPQQLVGVGINMESEIFFCAFANMWKDGSMADMLLKITAKN